MAKATYEIGISSNIKEYIKKCKKLKRQTEALLKTLQEMDKLELKVETKIKK